MWIKRWLAHYRNSILFRHITWILCLKVVLLWLIWQTIVKPYKMRPDSDMVFKHLISAQSQQVVTTPKHED